ncbi:hypothetical protein ABZS95_26775 [Streptomyces sp. NPDC005479]|uniref:hypothetical protein n=1 Tax=Streptomyces sp. NPDC005479 TaxID=3154879 RepID=UPI0033A5A5C4
MPKTLIRPKGAPADWPEFPAVDALTGETPLTADQWLALDLSWQLVTPYMLHFTTVTLHDALLVQPGAPGPVAMAYRHEVNRAYPDEALEHVTEKHPDAALPYVGRVLKAHRSYA